MGEPAGSSSDRDAFRRAADWVARRDRGLTPAEQDHYLQWLREDPRRAGWIAQHEASLRRMQGLASWQPALSEETNPDLFAPRTRRRGWVVPALAAAAVVAVGLYLARPLSRPVEPTRAAPITANGYLRVNERESLDDGSLVELRDGSRIEVLFSARERRVRLIGGEAHFTVAKNPARPFIVEAGGVAVRAIGTAFNVRFDAEAVDVLVTEGRVHVENAANFRTESAAATRVELSASQRTVVSLSPVPVGPTVVSVTAAEVREALAWQAPRLQFNETPLAEAVAEFNRRNPQTLVLGDASLGRIPIGGTFRADNVEGFVRLLEVTLGIRGERRGGHEIVLQPSR